LHIPEFITGYDESTNNIIKQEMSRIFFKFIFPELMGFGPFNRRQWFDLIRKFG